MTLRILTCWWTIVPVMVGTAAAQEVQSAKANRVEPRKTPVVDKVAQDLDAGRTPAAATVERIMEQAVRNIGVRYNLNENQRDITRKLMSREVHRFLREHEARVWPTIHDLLGSQFGQAPPDDVERVKRIGRTARPLVELAREAILRANEEWRLILTPEQKQVHDYDLAEMEKTFRQIDKNFSNWESGTPQQGQRIFPPPRRTGKEPPRPRKPEDVPSQRDLFDLHIFLTIVEEFSKKYELDEAQKTAARSILEEFQQLANDYKNSKKEEFSKIAAGREAAYAASDLDNIKKASAEYKRLLGPVYELCAQMEDRLEKLLTTAQIQQQAERVKAAEQTAEPAGDSAVDPSPQTQPAVKVGSKPS